MTPNPQFIVVFALTISLLCLSTVLYLWHRVVYGVWLFEDRFFGGDLRISEACLQCICVAGDECASLTTGRICEKFKISPDYWSEAGQPKLEGAASESLEVAYLYCVNNPFCAARAVSKYVAKHRRDCNGDGVIDCYDYAQIHIAGHRESSRCDNSSFGARLSNCMEKLSIM